MDTSLPSRPWTARRIVFLGIVGAILAASLTAGARLMNARLGEGGALERDEKRMADLQEIVARAQEVYERDHVLPASLDELQSKTKGRLSVADPESFEVYEYRLLEPTKFEVCARFERAASGGPDEHGVGRSCFQVTMN